MENWNVLHFRCNYCQQSVTEQFVKNILQRAGCDLDTMDKESENQCEKYSMIGAFMIFRMINNLTRYHFRYVQHYSKWLPPTHYFICDVEFTLAQLIGSDDPSSLQEMPEEKLQMKIMLCKKLLGIFGVIAAGKCDWFESNASNENNNNQWIWNLKTKTKTKNCSWITMSGNNSFWAACRFGRVGTSSHSQ